jgi:hypothetical protein
MMVADINHICPQFKVIYCLCFFKLYSAIHSINIATMNNEPSNKATILKVGIVAVAAIIGFAIFTNKEVGLKVGKDHVDLSIKPNITVNVSPPPEQTSAPSDPNVEPVRPIVTEPQIVTVNQPSTQTVTDGSLPLDSNGDGIAESRYWQYDKNGDGYTDTYYFDTNLNGRIDQQLLLNNTQVNNKIWYFDQNEDGYWDMYGWDNNNDNRADYWGWDNNQDNLIEVWGSDDNGDGITDRVSYDDNVDGIIDRSY